MAWKRHKQYRLYGFDYSQNGAYFITIVVKNRVPAFGLINNKIMKLSPLGEYVVGNIERIEERKNDIQIDEYQVMPDHIHLIITIVNKPVNTLYKFAKGLQPLATGSVSSFVNHMKGRITRWANAHQVEDFMWQSRFHDRIIRNEEEHNAIRSYIRNNVRDWDGWKNEFPD